MARKNLSDYPTSWGNCRVSAFVHTGPKSYTVITVATPATGGDPVSPSEAGLKAFDGFLGEGVSDNGQYIVRAFPPNGNTAGAGTAAATSLKSWLLQWIVAATGAEVVGTTDLSGRTVRLFAVGPK